MNRDGLHATRLATFFKRLDAKEKELSHQRAITLLKDAAFMLQNIKKNREMPPFAQTQQQYVALGDEIAEYLAEVEEQKLREQ